MANKKGGRPKTHELRKMPGAESLFADRAAALGGKRAAFLAAYSEVGSIKLAAETSGCDRTLHFYWMKTDPDYPELFREAGKEAFQLLKSRAHERAMEGSDTLMIFLLKAGEPETYRDTHHMYVDGKVRHTGEVDVKHDIVFQLLKTDRGEALLTDMAERMAGLCAEETHEGNGVAK